MKNLNCKRLEKYLKRCDALFSEHKAEIEEYISSMNNFSGIMLIEHLANNDKKSFVARFLNYLKSEFGITFYFSEFNISLAYIRKYLPFGYRSALLDYLEEIYYQNNRKELIYQKTIHSILDELPTGFSLKDKDNNILLINDFEKKRLQLENTPLLNAKSVIDTSNKGYYSSDDENNVITKGETLSYEEVRYDKNNNPYIYSETMRPFKIGDSGEKGILTISNDITSTKKYEEDMSRHMEDIQAAHDSIEEIAAELNLLNNELYETNNELNAANAQKDRLISIIGHDLKNPAGSVKNFLEALHEDYDEMTDTEKKEFIGYAYESSNKLVKLLLDLLEWGRLSRNKVDIKPVDINLTEVVNENIDLLEPYAVNKKIKIIDNTSGQIIHSDRNMISTVMRNLLNNAIKFTPEKGEVTISYEHDRLNHRISVKDNGTGIDKSIMNDLFMIDKVVTTPGTNHEEGTGLGLPICQEFVEKCNGDIEVISSPGEGAEFIIKIPLK